MLLSPCWNLNRSMEDSGMDGKKEETMDRFFVIFSESTVNLKRFIDGMRVSAESESAFHSHQQQLLITTIF